MTDLWQPQAPRLRPMCWLCGASPTRHRYLRPAAYAVQIMGPSGKASAQHSCSQAKMKNLALPPWRSARPFNPVACLVPSPCLA